MTQLRIASQWWTSTELRQNGTISLNVKNPEAQLPDAEKRRQGRDDVAERMLRFADRFKEGMRPGSKSRDHGDLFYGEDGLSR